MAVGFPAKTDFVTGEVLTATNMNDITGTLNLLQSTLYPAGRNKVFNSDFSVWQRGTSVAGATAVNYGADRWQIFRAGSTMSRQVTGDTTNLPFIQYCARVQRDSGTTAVGSIILNQTLETSNSIPFAGKTVALSFYARKGANYSQAASSVTALVYSGTGTNENQLNTFTGQATVTSSLVVLTSTWQRFTITGTVGATATQLAVAFQYTPVGTAGAADYFEITGVQLEAASTGSTASPFQTASGSIGGELALCQRYYYRITSPTAAPIASAGGSLTTTVAQIPMITPVEMRIAPTAADTANIEVLNYGNNTAYTGGSIVLNTSGPSTSLVRYVHGSAVFTAGQVIGFRSQSGTTGYLGLTAEL